MTQIGSGIIQDTNINFNSNLETTEFGMTDRKYLSYSLYTSTLFYNESYLPLQNGAQ